jgi:hypothetical protein
MVKKNLTIIDADGFIFYCGYKFKDQLNLIGAAAATGLFDDTMHDIMVKLGTDEYLGFHGSGEGDVFRHPFATIKTYKGARKSEPWHAFYKKVFRKHFVDKWEFIPLTDIEADDAVVIGHHQFKSTYNVKHVGEDKDFKQTGQFVRYNPKKKELQRNEHWSGRKFFWCQLIHGDNSDSIQGIFGKGEKCAEVKEIQAMVDPTEEKLFEVVREAYIAKYAENYLPFLVENYILLYMMEVPCFDYPTDIKPVKYIRKKKLDMAKLNL